MKYLGTFTSLALALICASLWASCAGSSGGNASGISLSQVLDQAQCPDQSDLRGAGSGLNEADALVQARAAVSSHIEVTLESNSESNKSSERINGDESLRILWSSKIKQVSRLANAQDAQQVFKTELDQQTGVVVCMSREKAARPFLDKQKIWMDSLSAAVGVELAQNHPQRKQNAWHEAKNIYVQLLALDRVLASLGHPNAKEGERREAEYEKLLADFESFRSHFGFYWEEAEGEAASVVLGHLSSRYKVETGECSQGVRLRIDARKPKCSEGSFGVQCTFQPVLIGTSCSGEVYFNLRADQIRGIGKYDEAEALQRLWGRLQNDSFWNQWNSELDKWRLE
jgi:hypothetical protein